MPDQSSAATEHAIIQEITAPLKTLPDDPVAVVNADFPVALRGYDRLTVDAYVQTTSQLVAELQATRSPEAAVRRALERVGEQISGILQRAHETAEEITAQSRREAEDRLEQARVEAAEIAVAAQQRVKDLDADTDRIWIERHRIVDDARDLAQQLTALAENAAERFQEADDATDAYADEDGPAPYAADELAPEPDEDVEATTRFAPLEPETGDEYGPAGHGVELPPGPEGSGSRSVIPPASQAANRRSNA
jgi:cell division septum initiation protein DivIVA